MRYNTLICEVEQASEQTDGSFRLKGIVTAAVGEDYEVGQQAEFTVAADKAEYLDDAKPGIYLLERVDGETGHCAFPSLVRDGRSAFPAWVGPLQAAWKDDRDQFHIIALDKAGLEGNALADAEKAIRKHAGSLRVFRDLVEIDEDGMPRNAMEVATQRWQDAIRGLIEDLPDMTGVIVRDGERSTIARLSWDADNECRKLVPPTLKDGTPVSFRNESVELIPVFQVNYLTNRFNPKKSTAVSVLTRETDKSEKQLAFEGKLYPTRGHFATGVAICRDLPSGGRTLEQVAASFPSLSFKHLPGAKPLPDNKSAATAKETKDPAAVLRSLGIPEDRIPEVLALRSAPGEVVEHRGEMSAPTDLKQQEGRIQRQAAPEAAQQQEPAQRQAAKATSEPAPAEPSPSIHPNVRTAPKVVFGRRR